MNKLFIIMGGIAFIGLLFLAAPSESDIKACQDQTGWSADRCMVELTR